MSVQTNSVQANDNYPNAHLLVDVEWLEANRLEPNVVILDARAQGYEAGHIPGAQPIQAKELKEGERYTFAAEDAVKRILELSGVSDGSTVIVYDDGKGVLATRVFYVLEYFGHKDSVKLLNGGYTAWIAADKEVETEQRPAEKGTITLVANAQFVVAKESIQAGLENSLLLDVRSADEYSGADRKTNRKGGHIKGAIHKEWKDALGQPDEAGVVRFKEYGSLKQDFEALGVSQEQTIVPYCQSNQRGAHTYFILRLLGYSDVRPYEGSWDEWGNAEHTEVEV